MNARVVRRSTAIAAASAALFIGLTSTAVAEYRCIAPQGVAERQACEAARQGPTELRRYVQKTRPVFNLYFYDYAPRDETWWTASDDRKGEVLDGTALADNSPEAKARAVQSND